MSGKLYVIGTPIGNIKDITVRALETIDKLDLLVCEDTRVTARLVNYWLDKGRLKDKPVYFAYNDFNEKRVYLDIVTQLQQGKQVGLVSDAGMPTVSDPGYKLIREALNLGIEIEIVPGVSALTTALAWSGSGGESVVYLGFLPKTRGKAEKILTSTYKQLEEVKSTRVVLYVSPYRLVKELELIREVMGEVRVVLLREMTKKFQERVELDISEMIERYKRRRLKGELVVVLSKIK